MIPAEDSLWVLQSAMDKGKQMNRVNTMVAFLELLLISRR